MRHALTEHGTVLDDDDDDDDQIDAAEAKSGWLACVSRDVCRAFL